MAVTNPEAAKPHARASQILVPTDTPGFEIVQNLAAEHPLLVVVDDAHWADAPSLRFLDALPPEAHGKVLFK